MNACNPKADTIPGGDARHADLAPQHHPPPLSLAPLGGKTVALDCDGGRLASAAGLVVRQDLDEQRGLTRAVAAALSDAREARRLRLTPAA